MNSATKKACTNTRKLRASLSGFNGSAGLEVGFMF